MTKLFRAKFGQGDDWTNFSTSSVSTGTSWGSSPIWVFDANMAVVPGASMTSDALMAFFNQDMNGTAVAAARMGPITLLGDSAISVFDVNMTVIPGASAMRVGLTPFDAQFSAKGDKPNVKAGGGGGDTSGVLTSYNAGVWNGAAGYDIIIVFKGTGWTAALQAPFILMADYVAGTGYLVPGLITDDLGTGGVYRGILIDDLYLTAELKFIDGTGGVLGQAGPTAVWTANELTATGRMQFDSADAAAYASLYLWDDIVAHEFMHVLGFGSLWNYGADPLVSTPGQYTGAKGLEAFNDLIPGSELLSFVPVETDGGSGTAGAHWDEGALAAAGVYSAGGGYSNELMTGWLNGAGILSKFSVMSLADLGYKVGYKDYPYDGLTIA